MQDFYSSFKGQALDTIMCDTTSITIAMNAAFSDKVIFAYVSIDLRQAYIQQLVL